MRLLVCGGRGYSDKEKVADVLYPIVRDFIDKHEQPFECLIEGGAEGADKLASDWAKSWKLPVKTFKADWDTHGKSAGILRNIQMLAEGKPHLVVAFPGGVGTAHMIKIAKKAGVMVVEV